MCLRLCLIPRQTAAGLAGRWFRSLLAACRWGLHFFTASAARVARTAFCLFLRIPSRFSPSMSCSRPARALPRSNGGAHARHLPKLRRGVV